MSYDYSTCIERQHPLIMEAQCNILFGFAFTLRAVLAGQTSTCLAFKEDLNDQNLARFSINSGGRS
jgi:hypothetical protein